MCGLTFLFRSLKLDVLPVPAPALDSAQIDSSLPVMAVPDGCLVMSLVSMISLASRTPCRWLACEGEKRYKVV